MTKTTSTPDNGFTRTDINALLEKSDKAVERGIVALYERQTGDEQCAAWTKHKNFRGFSKHNAKYGTYCAKWVLKGKPLTGKFLSRCRAICKYHSRQLAEEANAKLAASVALGLAGLVAFAKSAPKPEPKAEPVVIGTVSWDGVTVPLAV